ncbi:MAG: hypothetical protein P4L69_05800 [Desulfosporosinus sp.]|nr:hypothetical protein [Desulfosporosinus sp.]
MDERLVALNVKESCQAAVDHPTESALRLQRHIRKTVRTARHAPPDYRSMTTEQFNALPADDKRCIVKTLCPVCIERCADVALIPCGHVLCGTDVNCTLRPQPPFVDQSFSLRPNYTKTPANCPVCGTVSQGYLRVHFS